MDIDTQLADLEEMFGFPIKRREITLESKEPYDENVTYSLCHRFYNEPSKLPVAIQKATMVLTNVKDSHDLNQKAILFCVLGDLYYLQGDFSKSLGCYMKALSNQKKDVTPWAGFLFSIRALGHFDLFEDIIFHFEEFYKAWEMDTSWDFSKEKIEEMRRRIMA